MTDPARIAVEQPLLDIQDLEVSFRSNSGAVPAVRGVSLTVYPGQTVAIVGESGSGKSTTAHSIINLLPGTGTVTAGRILFEGRDLAQAKEKDFVDIRGSQIGLVPQDPMSNLNPVWKIGFQIEEALAANGIAKGKAARVRAAELLEEAGLSDSEKRVNQYPHEFSGGMRQRALIAIGLSARPKLLIADEPTSALDVTVQRQILDHLEGLTKELGTAVLLITHDLGLAAERAEHLVVMSKGRIVESGPALEILQDPQHPYTRKLVSAAPSLASQRLKSSVVRKDIVEHAKQVAVEAVTEETDSGFEPAADTVLVVEGLTKEFKLRGGNPFKSSVFTAVKDVSFGVARGTTTAIVGESGSGKSTVAQMVLGLLEPTAGSVKFDGRDVAGLNNKDAFAFRRRVQPIFQNPYGTLDPMYSIFSTIEEPLRTHKVGSKSEREARVRDLLDKVALPSSVMRRFPNELSGGQRQRVAIARALALEPEMVICDEAVSALDVLVQAQILSLLNDLQAELGLTYLFITHDLAVVRQIADDVLVMRSGEIVEAASTDAVFDNPQQEYTQKLLAAIPGGSVQLGA
ncbi:ABC transporter ATP-binding protein [Rhodococcus fascians]|uniref:dipeptide ABC transporter ATP-binding protein n=1 Tax=unclassified Rhodococcus (in: high G+C Gram-positive bacteria) TaxID=192944 RepID=UPI000B9C150D|nr:MULTISPECIES: ABC transporter ATP-binding protein [unclassified Rhodococcus (in: high G+C Gram-positive bacteria)]MBY3792557.1 ABC transporter ATP-binding protein [Rhodococcus fascians]MBY3825466.1 ABC transporter ATP-binding protein [Rhodococcus fascians]MBY3835928.1 ABC transporter ATP-binding protein [Rhodococcus fascians]MBY3865140.1 ABC transporter ATP-binding protein [Rhodococcus fascians]MBY3884458.1 ABC transporter ATP-binding protein [Rhodococcus fascians]